MRPGGGGIFSRGQKLGNMAAGHVNALRYVPDITVPVDPPIFPGPWIYSQLLGEAEQALYRCYYPVIRTHQWKRAVLRISTYNFRISPTDGASASCRHSGDSASPQGPWL